MAIFTGETVEDAIERGLNRLNVKRENVHIHIEQKEKVKKNKPQKNK